MKLSVTPIKSIFIVLSVFLAFTSCSKDKDDAVLPSAKFAGNYYVEDDTETYILQVVSKGNNNFQIKNFGGFLNVPINAVVEGNTLKIPSQTFKNPNGNSLTVVGSGILTKKNKEDDLIKIDYSVSGYTSYSSTIEGLRDNK
jgi:hypothetical protein